MLNNSLCSCSFSLMCAYSCELNIRETNSSSLSSFPWPPNTKDRWEKGNTSLIFDTYYHTGVTVLHNHLSFFKMALTPCSPISLSIHDSSDGPESLVSTKMAGMWTKNWNKATTVTNHDGKFMFVGFCFTLGAWWVMASSWVVEWWKISLLLLVSRRGPRNKRS